MRGWWRPLVIYGGLALGALVAAGARDPALLLPVVALTSPLLATVVLRQVLPPTLFLHGLREGGVVYEIVSDEVRWWGERRMRLRSAEGDWRIECHAGNSIHLRVRGPHMRRIEELPGGPRRAGREAAAAARG